MKRHVAIFCTLALLASSWSALQAAPRPSKAKWSVYNVDPNAKKVDVFKAVDDKQIAMQVLVQGPGSAVLALTNLTEQSLTIEVPTVLAAVPQVPQGANQAYYMTAFGTPGAPQTLAIAVNPVWTAGVEKKNTPRKTNVKTKKPKDEDAKEEKKDEDKDAKKDDAKKDDAKKDDAKKDEGKMGDSSVALVPLPPEAVQQVPLFSLGLELLIKKLAPRPGSPYTLAELDKVSQATELKKLMERYMQGTIPQDSAQVLAWRYHGRLDWDAMANSGIAPIQIETAKHFEAVLEGRAPAGPAGPPGKKRRGRPGSP